MGSALLANLIDIFMFGVRIVVELEEGKPLFAIHDCGAHFLKGSLWVFVELHV